MGPRRLAPSSHTYIMDRFLALDNDYNIIFPPALGTIAYNAGATISAA